jgi:hypothetical protein
VRKANEELKYRKIKLERYSEVWWMGIEVWNEGGRKFFQRTLLWAKWLHSPNFSERWYWSGVLCVLRVDKCWGLSLHDGISTLPRRSQSWKNLNWIPSH